MFCQRTLHVPVGSHDEPTLQVVPVTSSSMVTGTSHAPVVPQFMHAGQAAEPQHTPSRQLPDRQSVPVLQVWPRLSLHTPAESQAVVPLHIKPVSSALLETTTSHMPVV